MNRRKFIDPTALTTAALGIASILPERSRDKSVPAFEKLNVALTGCKNIGFGILEHHLSNPGVNCVALCDIDNSVLTTGAAEVEKSFNQKPVICKDFMQL